MDGLCVNRNTARLIAGRSKRCSLVKRTALAAFVIFAISLSAVAGPLAAAGPHTEGKKYKEGIYSRSFTNAKSIGIPDQSTASPYPSQIKVSGFKKAKIYDVYVDLYGFNHGSTEDVHVLLVAPNGDNLVLMGGVGGFNNASSLILSFDDDNGEPLPNNTPLESGTYQPTNYDSVPFPGAPEPSDAEALSIFKGGNPNGTWKLYVVDNGAGEVGAFSGGWQLTIVAKDTQHPHHGHHGRHGHHGHRKH